MNFKKHFTPSFFLNAIFALSLFILIFISGIFYKHSTSIAESSDWINHSYMVNIELEKMFSYLKDAESGQRGFIATNETEFLQPYNTALEKINGSFSNLQKLTEDNHPQKTNLDSLYYLINLRFAQLEKTLLVRKQIPHNQSLETANMRVGKNLMENVSSQIIKMNKLENTYLNERQQKYYSKISITPFITLLLLLFSLCVFAFSYYKINRDLKKEKVANEKLRIVLASMEHAEKIGDFSTWQCDLETNKLHYSDNQYRLLGCEPQSFEATIENFLKFVHPKDKPKIIEGGNEVIQGKGYPSAFFRITRKDGEVRYIKSLSKLLIDSTGKKTLIGINSDVTEQHLNHLILEERNRELEQSNKELASFNHVASHDLQEPLRKILTFISRISEKEIADMSESGKEYLTRIKISATRMRILIDDLLLFSRTNKTEKVFEKTDLNLLLEAAQQDLAQIIDEKNAIINSVSLPELTVIPFQIQQLFTNLISNSIKYSKRSVFPEIKIECEKVIAQEQSVLNTESKKNFYKIKFTDNGMGFDQQYAESIFTLFHRLHHDTEFAGTGIGLSICKKIIENHAGYIFAEGVTDVGATFTIFLPA